MIDVKKVIDGTIYNTQTATEVAKIWNGMSDTDFVFCTQGLYRTKKGSWFLAGIGGARSEYGNGCGSGSGVTLISADDALKWLEKNNFADAAIEYFDISEG